VAEGLVCAVRLLRDSAGSPCELIIAGVEARSSAPDGVAALVGRPLRDLIPHAADELLGRLGAAKSVAVEVRTGSGRADRTRTLTVHRGSEADLWTLTIGLSEPDGDARLKELNHRVLNSLAMLSSIIGLESRSLGDEAGRASLERVRSRLVAVSNLYRILASADAGSAIRADVYLKSVADAVAASVGLGDRIEVQVDAAATNLTTSQAAPLGLITNEAMTNAYKHAFQGVRDGRIAVALVDGGDVLQLTVADNGTGMSERARSGLGSALIESLAVDLSGGVSVASGGWGTSVQVRFPRAG
jgi:two-component sensor histidine kinase